MEEKRCPCEAIAIQNQGFRGRDFQITDEKDTHDGLLHFRLRCNNCQQEWTVEEDYSYHHPISYWQRITH
jgi:hypothetical protein